MPHMQHAGTIFYVGVCVRTATTNQMVSSTRSEAEVLGTRVIFFKYSYSYNLCVRYTHNTPVSVSHVARMSTNSEQVAGARASISISLTFGKASSA